MSVSRIPRSPEIIESPRALRQFFHNSPDINKVKKLAHKPAYMPPKEYSLMVPFKGIALIVGMFFLVVIHPLFKLIGATNLAIRTNLLFDHYRERCLTIGDTDSNILVPMMNQSRLDASDLYLSPPLKTSYGMIHYSETSGHCRGITKWFNFLYLKTRSAFSSPENHIRAVSKRFRKGSPIEAAFIQSLHVSNPKKTHRPILKALRLKHNYKLIERSNNIKTIAALAKKIYSLPQGCYDIQLPITEKTGHGISFIREKKERFYIDANKGAINISNPQILESFISNYVNLAKNPKGLIGIAKVKLA